MEVLFFIPAPIRFLRLSPRKGGTLFVAFPLSVSPPKFRPSFVVFLELFGLCPSGTAPNYFTAFQLPPLATTILLEPIYTHFAYNGWRPSFLANLRKSTT